MGDGDQTKEATQVYLMGKTCLANKQAQFFIKNDPIVQMAAGDRHTIVLTQTGRAFAFGDNASGQLGLGHTNSIEKVSCIKTLKFSDSSEKLVLVACGRESSIVATNKGKVFAFGSNSHSQLGFDSPPIQSTPKLVEFFNDYKLKQLAMGAEHSCALTDDGDVFVWGNNEEGQCGDLLKFRVIEKPKQLRLDRTINWISCGNYHTAFIDENGKLLLCGSNDDHQLGYTKKDKDSDPKEVSMRYRAKSVCCGHQHTVVLMENGEVYTCGNGSRGQLGLGQQISSIENFEKIDNIPKKINEISAGEGHTALISARGDLYVFGDGKHGKLGSTTQSNEFEPCRVEKFKGYQALMVVCGGLHTVVLASKRPEDQNRLSESDEDIGNATLSVTQRPKSRARVSRNKSLLERSQNVSDSVDATTRSVRPLGASNHLRVEPARDSDVERSDNELSASMKSLTFNQTHATINGKLRPTQDPTLGRTGTQRTNGDELKPIRTGVLDRTARLNPNSGSPPTTGDRSPQPIKRSQPRSGRKQYSDDDLSDPEFREEAGRNPSIALPSTIPLKSADKGKSKNNSDSDEDRKKSSTLKNKLEPLPILRKGPSPKPKSSDESEPDTNRRSSPPKKFEKPTSTRRRSSSSENDSRKREPSPPPKKVEKPASSRRRSSSSESDSRKREPSPPPKKVEKPTSSRRRSSSSESDSRKRESSPPPKKVEKPASTRRRSSSSESDSETRRASPRSSRADASKPAGNEPKRGFAQRDNSDSDEKSTKKPPLSNRLEPPKSNRNERRPSPVQRGRNNEVENRPPARPLPNLRNTKDIAERSSNDDDSDSSNDRKPNKAPASSRQNTSKVPEPAPRHGTSPASSQPTNDKSNADRKPDDKNNSKPVEQPEVGFFARIFGSKSTPPPANNGTQIVLLKPAAAAAPPPDSSKESRTCSLM